MQSSGIRFPAAAAVFAAAFCALRAAGDTVDFGEASIAGDRVNVRAAADGLSQVLGQFDYDARVGLAGPATDPWVKIFLPASFDAWIYTPLLKKDAEGRDVVGVNRAQFRAGPGLHHASIGMATRGEPMEVRGKSGDWTKVSPAGHAVFGFVTNRYVKAAPGSAPKPAEPAPSPAAAVVPAAPPPVAAPEPAPPPVQVAQVSRPVPPPVPSEAPAAAPVLVEEVAPAVPSRLPGAGRDVATASPSAKPRRTLLSAEPPTPIGPAGIPSTRLRGEVAQARPGSYAGTLAKSPSFGSHPSRWRLVRFVAEDAAPQTVCYVYGNDAQLSGLRNRFFTVSGAVYFFRGTSLPTVYAQDIVLGQGAPGSGR